jgi:hypothetical protein
MMTIKPHVTVHVYAVESYACFFLVFENKGFSVPGGTAHYVSALFCGGTVFIEGADDGAVVLVGQVFDGPVVGEMYCPPVFVLETWLFSSGEAVFFFQEFPVIVKQFCLSECVEAGKQATEKKYFMDLHIHLLFFAMAV